MQSQDIKKAGLRLTIPRMKILAVLDREDGKHVSAEDIYRTLLDEGEEVSLGTIYRVLTQFELAGMVIRHRFSSDTAVFELDHGHHDHMVCTQCGKIVEFTDKIIAGRLQKIATDNKVKLSDHKLILYVDCCGHE